METCKPDSSPSQESSHDTGSSAKSIGTGRMGARGIIDRALHHRDHVHPLDGGSGDTDQGDSETDTAIPDDDDDIVSLASLAGHRRDVRTGVGDLPAVPASATFLADIQLAEMRLLPT